MSVEVRTNIKDPLGWMQDDYGIWNLVSDYAKSETYWYLDCIYHYLVEGVNYDERVVEGKSDEDLKEEYNDKFPFLLAEAFENIAKDIRDGELIIKTEFE